MSPLRWLKNHSPIFIAFAVWEHLVRRGCPPYSKVFVTLFLSLVVTADAAFPAPITLELGIAMVPWSPLGSGFLTGKTEPLGADDFRRNIALAGNPSVSQLDQELASILK